jgi:serine/threonine protein kinase
MIPLIPPGLHIPGYKIEKRIAEGGMASVYLARQESLNRRVALKLLRKFDSPSQAARFFNEGRIIASLEHRNIITIFDLGVVGERHYLAMEFLQGGDLRARMNYGMTPFEVLELMETLGLCLDFVHQKGIIHRDIKPENILFRKDGSVVLTDFGVAKHMEIDATLTLDGTTLGSPYYLSPEQAKCKELDGRADIFSLGIICYEMLAGFKPFQGDSAVETITARLTPNIPLLPPDTRCCQPLVDRMIAQSPEDRFSSGKEMAEFARDLRTSLPKRKLLEVITPSFGNYKTSGTSEQTLEQSLESRFNGAEIIAVQHPKASLYKRLLASLGLIVILMPGTWFFLRPVPPTDKLEVRDERPLTGIAAPGVLAPNPPSPAAAPPSPSITVPAQEPLPANLPVPDVETALQQAEAILKDKQLTLLKLKQAYDLYQLALDKNPRNQQALRGVSTIAHKFIAIKSEIERYLVLANSAIKNDKSDPQGESQSIGYYRQILALEPGHPEALRGLEKLAERYADRAEADLRNANHAEAEHNLRLGLSLQAAHPRLRALAASLKIDPEAGSPLPPP